MIHVMKKYWPLVILLFVTVIMLFLWMLFSGSGYNNIPSRGVFIRVSGKILHNSIGKPLFYKCSHVFLYLF